MLTFPRVGMFDDSSSPAVIDDTKPLTVTITSAENNGSYIVSIVMWQRGQGEG